MKKKFKLVIAGLCFTAFIVGPGVVSANQWPGCGNRPCYEDQ